MKSETNQNRPLPDSGLNGTERLDESSEGLETNLQLPVDAGGSDIARLQTENEQLKTSIRLTEAHRQITGELEKAGARSPGLLFESVKADLQFAEDGRLANAAALLERLKTSLPEQFGFDARPASIDGGAGTRAQPQLTKEALSKMKPAEIAELDWADVKRVLALG